MFRVRIDTKTDINRFINIMSNETDEYTISDASGKHCVSAKSLLAIMYSFSEFDEMYLKNEDNPGHFPAAIEEFRA